MILGGLGQMLDGVYWYEPSSLVVLFQAGMQRFQSNVIVHDALFLYNDLTLEVIFHFSPIPQQSRIARDPSGPGSLRWPFNRLSDCVKT
jgi:hypothetical protein